MWHWWIYKHIGYDSHGYIHYSAIIVFLINVPICFLYSIYNILISGHVLKGWGDHTVWCLLFESTYVLIIYTLENLNNNLELFLGRSESIWIANTDGGESYFHSPGSLISVFLLLLLFEEKNVSDFSLLLLFFHHCLNIELWLWVGCGLVALKLLCGRFGDIVLYGSPGAVGCSWNISIPVSWYL